MKKLAAISVKFANILEDLNNADSFGGGFYDPTGYARKALNIDGNKYPANQSGEGTMVDGSKVRLLTSEQAKAMGTNHRLQILCKYCNKWIPAGRVVQHESPCAKKNAPMLYKQKQDFKHSVQKFKDDIAADSDFNSKIEKTLVFMDMLEENGDPRWFSIIENLKQDTLRFQAKQIFKEKGLDSTFMHFVKSDDTSAVFIARDDINKYKLTLFTDKGKYTGQHKLEEQLLY